MLPIRTWELDDLADPQQMISPMSDRILLSRASSLHPQSVARWLWRVRYAGRTGSQAKTLTGATRESRRRLTG